jgi:hypothetical protein
MMNLYDTCFSGNQKNNRRFEGRPRVMQLLLNQNLIQGRFASRRVLRSKPAFHDSDIRNYHHEQRSQSFETVRNPPYHLGRAAHGGHGVTEDF